MAYPDILNIESLLNPISDDQPTGINPRDDISPTSVYYTLKDVRNTARANERNALMDEEPLLSIASEWRPILQKVPEALATTTKDLEFVAWLIEALCRIHGFKGLTQGFKTATALIENFWDDLYPEPDEEGQSTRIAPIVGLNGYEGEGALIMPITAIPITEGFSDGPFATWEFQQAAEIGRLSEDKQRQKIEGGACSMKAFDLAVKETSPQFFISLHSEIEAAIDAFSELSDAMDKAMGGEPQPTSYISKTLKQCLEAVTFIAKDVLEKQSDNEQETELAQDSDNPELEQATQTVKAGVIAQLETRDDAIKNLKKIGEFFRKTEPHSPMSYAIEQVVRWSDLSLPELLQELISDNDARSGFFKLSGIKQEES